MPSPAEQIKERLGIVEVIQSYIKLLKAGSNFKASCPFHREKTPSFFVSPSRGIWHCFGCNSTGDIFEFVKKIEGVEFPEALQILADRAGIQIKREDPRLRNERTRLLELLERAASFYENNLKTNQPVLNYLKERGLTLETIKNFRLGYALGEWRSVYNFLISWGYKETEIEKSGLIIKAAAQPLNPSGYTLTARYYDRFRNRIMFPLFDSSGRIVGFSGRIFEVPTHSSLVAPTPPTASSESVGAKYINTPQTLLYDKSRILYGFESAKNAIRKEDSCILVEGQMDLIMCHQIGISNSVAVSGTALTSQHLNSIGRLTNNLITAFDMDEAGSLATKRGVDLAIEEGFEVRITSIPFGKDPADIAKENPEALKESFQNAKNIIAFFLESLKKKFTDSRSLKQEVAKVILPYVALIKSPMDSAHWVSLIASNLNMREEPLWEEIKKMGKRGASDKSQINSVRAFSQPKKRRELLEERLMGIAFWKKGETLKTIRETENYFSNPSKELIKKIKKEIKASGEEAKMKNLEKFAFEAELMYNGTENLEKEVDSLISELKRESIKEELQSVAASIKIAEESGNEEKLAEELDEFKKLSIELAKFNSYPKLRFRSEPKNNEAINDDKNG